jgi:signal transduction histidine kinase
MTARWRQVIRAQDVVWLLLFSALGLVSPRQSLAEIEMLAALAVLQVAAPRIESLNTPRGNAAVIALQLLVGFLLIGVTGGILSSYYLILLLPVLSAATTLGARGTALVTLLACAAYASFLPLAWRFGYDTGAEVMRDLSLRVIFLPVVAYLTYGLAESNRNEARRAQAAAAQLAEANARLLEAEAGMRRSERLAALGQLTAGLAHDLRNPMGTIRASAEMLGERAGGSDPLVKELTGYISSEVDRANSLITRFLEFARPIRLRRAPLDLNALVDRVIEDFERRNGGLQLSIHRNYDPGIPQFPADAELLERVVTNLIQNALEASPPGSTVTVKTRALPDAVELAVIDRGSGIRPEHREQIFNPFFTTKPAGVGLGLAICAKIVDEHGGSLRVESEPGRGSIFLVSLPLADRSEAEAASSQV